MAFDILIKDATIVDGSGGARYVGDVGVRDGKIAEIGRINARADRTIDAEGLILSPGFIDGHTHMDAQVGRILAALEESGQADDTVVIFTSDHGLAMGSHGLMGKQNHYDHSIRAPFIVKGPGVPAGAMVPGMFYLSSVFPTAAEMAGVEVPETVEAPSIVPLINGEKDAVYEYIYGSYRHFQRMVRSQDWKLIYYPMIQRTQLFNLAEDPEEMNDLADDPANAERIAAMMQELESLKAMVGDPLINEAPEESYGEFLRLTWD